MAGNEIKIAIVNPSAMKKGVTPLKTS